MAVKRFGGGGKTAALGAAVMSGIGDVAKQLERPIDRSRGVYERISVEEVRPDPKNPRNLNLAWEELLKGVAQLNAGDGAQRTTRTKIYEAVIEKANSFKRIGQLQPIVVYRDDNGMLRIVDGETRYWAARLAEWTEIDAKVRSERPRYLRLEQYAANVLRDDLSLSSHLNNLEMVLDEMAEEGTPVESLNEFAGVLGRPRTTVQYWWSILREPHDDVRAAIRSGSVTSLETAYTAAQERDPGRRAALLEGGALPAHNAAPKTETRTPVRGRRKTAVELGRVADLQTVRCLIEAIPVDVKFDDTDWADARSVQKAWTAFLDSLAKRIKKTGSALS